MKYRHQFGLSIMELMVSLTLGLLIALASMQLFLTNQKSFNLQSGMGNVQENGRFALDYINSTIRNAEYQRTGNSTPTLGVVTDSTQLPGVLASNNMVSANDLTALGIGNSDQLVTRMWVSDTMIASGFRDCEGNAVTVPSFVVTRYFIRADTASNSTAALACDAGSYTDDATAMTNYQDSGVVLLSAVDSFQFMLGVTANATTPLGQRFPVRYMTVADYLAIIPATNRPLISSIRLGILVKSTETVANGEMPANDIKVLEKTISASSLNDKRIHRLFTSTLAMRNAL